ncbi:type 2 lanthipeptide synthetase LanM family protein [Krasilnikovia sp. MM14-A1259]|uniref:type 2 lanthipeptide synthetase LanM family protein n=1 Tax=Krasilnikovia sp. MM14-A1259 TaxID=3373539 RepID=UPI003813A60A
MTDAPPTSRSRSDDAAADASLDATVTPQGDRGWWAAALTLAERAPGHSRRPPTESATRRLRDWRAAHGLGDSGQFTPRLDDLGLGEEDLQSLLAEPPADVAARISAPDWAAFAGDVLAAAAGSRPTAPGVAEPRGATWAGDFARILAPFLDVSDGRLARTAPDDGVDLPAIRAEFRRGLASDLVRLSARALVLDLSAAREAGGLTGPTPQDRFADFVRRRQTPAAFAAFLRRYPVLARIIAQRCQNAIAATAELLRRFATDRPAIVATFFAGRDPGPLTALELGAGDSHQHGRTVGLLRFASGARLVYKPRPLGAHRHFNELVRWLNVRVAAQLSLRTLTVLERDGYGWVEFVAAQPCTDRDGVARFYRRQGFLLALLYALDGADVHYENLIACADQPVLVDVETLFHPHLPVAADADPAAAALARSVHRSALLPLLLLGDDSALDVSGLGGGTAEAIPVPVAGWHAVGTDEMRLVRHTVHGVDADNRPRLASAAADPAGHAEVLLDGFRTGYDMIARHRDELLGPGGAVQRFAADEMRLVARPTRIYQTLLDESTHPGVLRDGLDRDRLFDVLWAGSAGDRVRLRLVPYENAQLWQGDVPFFTLRPGGRDLYSGTDRIADALDSTPLDQVGAKLRGMGDVDRQDQEWVIRAALATRLAYRAHDTGEPDPRPYQASAPDADRLLGAARGIADQIVARGFDDGDRINWLGLEPLDERYWAVMPLGAGLATGYTGVALFLAQLAALTGDARYAAAARRALQPLPALITHFTADPAAAQIVGCGGFAGFGGIAYALAQVAGFLDDRAAAELIAPIVHLADTTLDSSDDDSVHGGVAGCLVSMLAVHAMSGLADARTIADRAARRLLETAAARTTGPGFAFGAAGTGWALLRYAAAADDARAGRRGRDQLVSAAVTAHGHSWCEGRPGVVLALLDTLEGATDGIRALVDRTVDSVTRSGPLPNHSLCHGELGRLELVGAADRPAQLPRAGMALSALDTSGPQCGTPGRVTDPGLLHGLAGIGHGLLRVARPDRIPAALLLQPATPTHPSQRRNS